MIPKFLIPLFYVFVQVSTAYQEMQNSAIITTEINRTEFTTNNKNVQSNEKVKIQLYYESLCPYCKSFVTGSFKNTVIELRSYLDLYIYPFGHAWIQENGTIACQHGPDECYGNKLHACAIDFLDDIILAVIFNGCMMEAKKGSDDVFAHACGINMGIDSEPIKQCAKGLKGEELLKYYGKESKKVHYKTVPYVLINGAPGRTDDNFKTDVCNSFKNPPKPCKR